jgi:hypothetical protein
MGLGCLDAVARLLLGVLLLIIAAGLASCQSGAFF